MNVAIVGEGYLDLLPQCVWQTMGTLLRAWISLTVPVGTNDKQSHMLEERLRNLGKKVRLHVVVSNPEFLSQGTAIEIR